VAAAYAGGQPYELRLLSYLDRFGGAQNVLGRALGAGEMRRMIVAENISKWRAERDKSESWAAWENDNPEKAQALHDARKLAIDEGFVE